MGAESIDIELNGSPLRIMCSDPEGTARIRSALYEHLIDEPAPIGFSLQAPTEEQRLFVLLDRSGFVLGRSRRLEDALSTLGGHLAAFLPAPPGTVRLRLRAILDHHDRAVVAIPPLLTLPPLVERRLASLGCRIVDRMVLDLDAAGCVHAPRSNWQGIANLEDGSGHVSGLRQSAHVAALLLPGAVDGTTSRAQVVHAVASTAVQSDQRKLCLDVAEAISDQIAIAVDPGRPEIVYQALANLS